MAEIRVFFDGLEDADVDIFLSYFESVAKAKPWGEARACFYILSPRETL